MYDGDCGIEADSPVPAVSDGGDAPKPGIDETRKIPL
jgi:hypothetical protein